MSLDNYCSIKNLNQITFQIHLFPESAHILGQNQMCRFQFTNEKSGPAMISTDFYL